MINFIVLVKIPIILVVWEKLWLGKFSKGNRKLDKIKFKKRLKIYLFDIGSLIMRKSLLEN